MGANTSNPGPRAHGADRGGTEGRGSCRSFRAIQDEQEGGLMRCVRCNQPVFEDDQGLYSQFPVTSPEMPGFTFMDRAHGCGEPPAPHKAPASAHVRETATPSEFLSADELAEVFTQTGVTPGPVIVGECWCGTVYAVPQGDDEYGALETAHKKHIQEVA